MEHRCNECNLLFDNDVLKSERKKEKRQEAQSSRIWVTRSVIYRYDNKEKHSPKEVIADTVFEYVEQHQQW